MRNNVFEEAVDIFDSPIADPFEKKYSERNKFKILKKIDEHFKYGAVLSHGSIFIKDKEYSMEYFAGMILDGRDKVKSFQFDKLSENIKIEFAGLFSNIDDIKYVQYISCYLTNRHQRLAGGFDASSQDKIRNGTAKLGRCPSCNQQMIDDSPMHTFWPCPHCDYTLKRNSGKPFHCRIQVEY